jgi:hypothetical protein|tara:strand:- start:1371 stop:1559 length:189 start_codon:yes stop_codon:yes gene_type:complete
MKKYKVVIDINKQETYFVKANSKEEAEEMGMSGEGYSEAHDWQEWAGLVETTVEEEMENEND